MSHGTFISQKRHTCSYKDYILIFYNRKHVLETHAIVSGAYPDMTIVTCFYNASNTPFSLKSHSYQVIFSILCTVHNNVLTRQPKPTYMYMS